MPNTGTPRTEADLLTNFFQDGQANNSITAQDMRDFVASTRYLSPLGWEFRYDSQYDDSNLPTSAMNLVDLTPQKITFTDNPGEDLRYPSTWPNLWDGATQRLVIPTFLNGFGIIRLSCIARAANTANTHMELFVDVGSDPVSLGGSDSNLIYEDSVVFAKGNNTPQAINWIIPLFGGSDFATNGATFILQSHGGTADVWQFTLTAGAIFVPNPAGEG